MPEKGYRQDQELECEICKRVSVLKYDLTIKNASTHAEGYIERYSFVCPDCAEKKKLEEVAKARMNVEEEVEENITDAEILDETFEDKNAKTEE